MSHSANTPVIVSGADVHGADQDNNTPLHIAARYGHELLINTLVQHGADIARLAIREVFYSLFYNINEICLIIGCELTNKN